MATTLSYLQEAAIRDKNGNCRCPWCGRYRKRAEFPTQSISVDIADGKGIARVHAPPACRFCLKEGEEI